MLKNHGLKADSVLFLGTVITYGLFLAAWSRPLGAQISGSQVRESKLCDLTDAEGKPDGREGRGTFSWGERLLLQKNLSPILTLLTLRQTTKLACWEFFLSLYPKHADY